MTWVARTPRRSDFCGCPPCPLCFCWAGDDGLVDGMTKFTQDMLGGKSPSANETQILKDAAEAIHVANLSLPERIDAELKEADKAQHTERKTEAFFAQKRAEMERPVKAKKDERPVLDDLDPKVFEKPKQPERFVTFGNSAFVTVFDELLKTQMAEMFTARIQPERPKSFFTWDTAATPLDEPAKKDAKEIQADFARENAKKRMREMARAKR